MILLIDLLFQVYILLLFARILGSWVPELQKYKAMQFVAFYTDPYLNIFRRIIPPLGGVLDISPIIAFFALSILRQVLHSLVQSF
jgi:YggT family protein